MADVFRLTDREVQREDGPSLKVTKVLRGGAWVQIGTLDSGMCPPHLTIFSASARSDLKVSTLCATNQP